MRQKSKKQNSSAPALPIVIACLIAIVALALIDSLSTDFSVDKIVYAIIAGVLFGIGNIRNLIGGNHDN